MVLKTSSRAKQARASRPTTWSFGTRSCESASQQTSCLTTTCWRRCPFWSLLSAGGSFFLVCCTEPNTCTFLDAFTLALCAFDSCKLVCPICCQHGASLCAQQISLCVKGIADHCTCRLFARHVYASTCLKPPATQSQAKHFFCGAALWCGTFGLQLR